MLDIIPVPVDDPLQMVWLDRNDLGNAKRLVRLARGLLLWVEEVGWLAYDGKRWSAKDGELRAHQLAHEVAGHIDREAAALALIASDPGALEEAFGYKVDPAIAGERVVNLRKHAVASGDASRTAAMLKQARTLIPAQLDEFDADPLAFNLANGTLRYFQKKGGGWDRQLDPHEPNDRLMQIARFAFDPDADCPRWKERLLLIQPKKDQRGFLQRRYGYMTTGLTDEQKWFIDQGLGGDGKSLTNRVIARGMGDYYCHADVSSFLKGPQKSGADHSADMERLRGDIRFVLCDEPDRNSTWNGTRLKQITGSELTARGVGAKKSVDFEPHWKLVVEVNTLPAVPSDDDGFWRRVVPLIWEYQFDKGGVASVQFARLVAELLADEGSGILNWMIAGALKWLDEGRLPMPEGSALFLDNYRTAASPIGEWIGEACDISDRAAITPSGLLYKAFKAWCEERGLEKVPTQTAFGRWLRDRHHLEHKDSAGTRFRRGIKFRPDGVGGGLGAAAAADEDRGGGRGATILGPDDERDWREDLP